MECGYLTVAEDCQASSPTDRGALQLAVGVFKADHPSAGAAPLLYLDGGPGGPALDDVVALWRLFAPLAVDRDLVVFDQRGTGHSKPALMCDDIMVATDAGESDFVTACRNDLAAKVVSLSHFDSASSATDINDLRIALGYPAWDLFGISYGTRLALTVLRDYPDSVRSIVIDSVLPPQVDALAEAGQTPTALSTSSSTRALRSRTACAPFRRCGRTFTTPSRRSRRSRRKSHWTAAESSPSRPTLRWSFS